jgi:hypothetical protein
MKHITPVLLLAAGVFTPCQAIPVVPNFTSGTVTSQTTTRTEVVESIKQIEYSTGTSYTVTGTNINIPSNPVPGANYTIMNQGAPFQFSETYLVPGVSKETWIERKTIEDSVTNTISVFTQ